VVLSNIGQFISTAKKDRNHLYHTVIICVSVYQLHVNLSHVRKETYLLVSLYNVLLLYIYIYIYMLCKYVVQSDEPKKIKNLVMAMFCVLYARYRYWY